MILILLIGIVLFLEAIIFVVIRNGFTKNTIVAFIFFKLLKGYRRPIFRPPVRTQKSITQKQFKNNLHEKARQTSGFFVFIQTKNTSCNNKQQQRATTHNNSKYRAFDRYNICVLRNKRDKLFKT